jgi:hypothetical protein
MGDETEIGPAGAAHGGRHTQGGGEFSSPFQARAQFLKNWHWQSVVGINRGTCERGKAQHGTNSETGKACAAEWEGLRSQTLTLIEDGRVVWQPDGAQSELMTLPESLSRAPKKP